VGDIVDAAVTAFQNETLKNDVFNLGTGCARPLRDYIEQIRTIIQPRSDVHYGALPFRTHELWTPLPDVHLAAEQLHWHSTHSLEQGLQRTISWFRENDGYYEDSHKE
jgi:nucleoside-diphosphate-sugar epimerase